MNILFVIFALLVLIAIFYFLSKNKGDLAGLEDSIGLENDARRFARLLVSEIKLYNEDKVQRGLQNNNLAESLRDEIVEARSRYNKRIAGDDMQSYFDDALVEILADGDATKLGSGIRSCFK